MQRRAGKEHFQLRNKGQIQGADLTLLHSFFQPRLPIITVSILQECTFVFSS